MKNNLVKRLLCAAIVSSMCITNSAVALAHTEEQKTALYEGKEITVTVSDDIVIFEDGTTIPLCEFTGEFIGEEIKDEAVQAPETGPAPVPEGTEDGSVTAGESGKGETAAEPGEGETAAEPDGNGTAGEPEEDGTAGEPNGEVISAKPNEKATSREPDKEIPAVEPEEDKGKVSLESGEEEKSPVYMAPSVTAGIGFYIDELEEKYHLTFEDEFADVVSEIEEEFEAEFAGEAEKAAEKDEAAEPELDEAEEDSEEEDETFRFRNWQDVLAIYLLNERKSDEDEYIMDASDKSGIAYVFAQMNEGALVDGELVVDAKYVDDYMEEKEDILEEDERDFIKKYTSADCGLLCAAATGIRGFITESLGEDISEERAKVVEAAYSLVGKVAYFWGGKVFGNRMGSKMGESGSGYSRRQYFNRLYPELWSGLQRLCDMGIYQWI